MGGRPNVQLHALYVLHVTVITNNLLSSLQHPSPCHMSSLAMLRTSHASAEETITHAQSKTTTRDALTHLRDNSFCFLGVPASTLTVALKEVSDTLAQSCKTEVQAQWACTDYFKAEQMGATARAEGARLAEMSFLFKKVSEHVHSTNVVGGSISTFEFTLQPRDEERIFRSYAREALHLDVKPSVALQRMDVGVGMKSLLIRQRGDARHLKYFPDYPGAAIGQVTSHFVEHGGSGSESDETD